MRTSISGIGNRLTKSGHYSRLMATQAFKKNLIET